MGELSEGAAAAAMTEGMESEEGKMSRDEAHDVLTKFNSEFKGETLSIPMDQYPEMLKAAVDYKAAVDRLEKIKPGARDKDEMIAIAEKIIAETPKDLQAVA